MSPRDVLLHGGAALVRHHAVASVVLCALALLATLAFPLLARKFFVDENAFILGAASTSFDAVDAKAAASHAANAREAIRVGVSSGVDATDALRGWVSEELEKIRLDVFAHEFARTPPRGSRANATVGRNLHGIARARKGNGREGIVLVTPIGDPRSDGPDADADALALLLALTTKLRDAPWLAKDLCWLVPDARVAGPVPATDAWLREYHHPSGSAGERFGRVGAIQQAYAVELPRGASFDRLRVSMEGRNGALPNMDLVSVAIALGRGLVTTRGDATRVKRPELEGGWARVESAARPLVGRRAAAGYVGDARSVVAFMRRLASGTPTGAHASFKSFAMDAITLRGFIEGRDDGGRRRGRVSYDGARAFHAFGILLESLTRSSNNLLELLHHSMFYYVIVDDFRFLSIAEYVAPSAMMLFAMVLTAGAIAGRGWNPTSRPPRTEQEEEEEEPPPAPPSHDWSSAFAVAFAAHLSGCLAGATCVFAHDAGLGLGVVAAATWVVAYGGAAVAHLAASNFGFFDAPRGPGVEPAWSSLWVVTLSVTSTALGALTFFNFALALPVTAVLAPLCLAAGRGPGSSGRAAATALAPLAFALPFDGGATSLGALASHHRSWTGGTFALPLMFGVVWPAVMQCALIAAARRPTRARRRVDRGKKTR